MCIRDSFCNGQVSGHRVLVPIGLFASPHGHGHGEVPGGEVRHVLAGGHLAAVFAGLKLIILHLYGRKLRPTYEKVPTGRTAA